MSKKNRIVSFRLSDAEYHRLVEACQARGAHSVSSFARSAVKGHSVVSSNSDVEGEIVYLQEQVDELQLVLERILELAKQKEKGSKIYPEQNTSSKNRQRGGTSRANVYAGNRV